MIARLRTDLFVDALRALVQSHGGFSTIFRHGHDEAGMAFVVLRKSQTKSDIFGEYRDLDGNTQWRTVAEALSDEDVTAWIEREADFDPDIWVIEVEQVPLGVILSHTR